MQLSFGLPCPTTQKNCLYLQPWARQGAHSPTLISQAAADDGSKFVSVVLSGRASDVFQTAHLVDGVVNVCLAVLTVSVLAKDVAFLQSPGVRAIQKEIPIDTLKLPRKVRSPWPLRHVCRKRTHRCHPAHNRRTSPREWLLKGILRTSSRRIRA